MAGAVTLLPGSLAPGTTEHWTVTARPANLHLTQFGVYPLAAQVTMNGQPLDHQRTFLPFWPGSAHRAGLAEREKLAWVWPLIGQPQQQSCAALLTDDLAGSLATTGRLGRLLADGSAAAASGADLTWAIDPSLVASATDDDQRLPGGRHGHLRRRGQQAGQRGGPRLAAPSCRSVTARQDFFTTPYADVDSSALTHAGLDDNLTRAYDLGQGTAQKLLGSVQRPAGGPLGQIAWPAAGIADYPVLSSLAANDIGTVILNSSLMPPKTPAGYTPSAITTTLNGVNAGMHVALADSTLSQLLADAPTAAASRPAAGSFATEQRFLAETAMIAAEQPRLPRTVVVTPPRQWNPAPGLASQLLTETVQAPWLRPASLASLVTAGPGAGQVARPAPPRRETGHGELHKSLLRKLKAVENGIRLQASILDESRQLPGQRGGHGGIVGVAGGPGAAPGPARPDHRLPQRAVAAGAHRRHRAGHADRQVRLGPGVHQQQAQRQGHRPAAGVGAVRADHHRPADQDRGDRCRTSSARSRCGSTRRRLAPPCSSCSCSRPMGSRCPGTTAQLTVDATHFGSLAMVIIAVAVACS